MMLALTESYSLTATAIRSYPEGGGLLGVVTPHARGISWPSMRLGANRSPQAGILLD